MLCGKQHRRSFAQICFPLHKEMGSRYFFTAQMSGADSYTAKSLQAK